MIQVDEADYHDLVERSKRLAKIEAGIREVIRKLQYRATMASRAKSTYEGTFSAKGRKDAYTKAWKLISSLRK